MQSVPCRNAESGGAGSVMGCRRAVSGVRGGRGASSKAGQGSETDSACLGTKKRSVWLAGGS